MVMLREQVTQVHQACARALHGLVSTAQLAIHHESGSLHREVGLQLIASTARHRRSSSSSCARPPSPRLAVLARAPVRANK